MHINKKLNRNRFIDPSFVPETENTTYYVKCKFYVYKLFIDNFIIQMLWKIAEAKKYQKYLLAQDATVISFIYSTKLACFL